MSTDPGVPQVEAVPAPGDNPFAAPAPGAELLDPARWTPPPATGRRLKPAVEWGPRVGASLIASLLTWTPNAIGILVLLSSLETVVVTPSGQLGLAPSAAGLITVWACSSLATGLWVWNRVVRQGRTGQSLGKRALGLRLLSTSDGKPPGIGRALLRELAHALDAIAYVGYLRPLWDHERRTFADELRGTRVIRVGKRVAVRP